MKRFGIFLILSVFVLAVSAQEKKIPSVLDLSGKWDFRLDAEDFGFRDRYFDHSLEDSVFLPGTTDTNRKGFKNTDKRETTYLSRLYRYEGPAWYSRSVEIPSDWHSRRITLFLERTKPTQVWIDGHFVGRNDNLSVPQLYDLTDWLVPGRSHRLTIRVDNGKSIPEQIRVSSHACSESTQTNWNGIIGRMELEARNRLHIVSLQVYPDTEKRSAIVRLCLSESQGIKGKLLKLQAIAFNTSKTHRVKPKEFLLEEGCSEYEFVYPLGENAQFWSEFHPALYRLTVGIGSMDQRTVEFGLRNFSTQGNKFTINGHPTFLRGKHDACVFPLTAHVPMDVESWRRYFRIVKEYGINHCRFHSWCPPEACFQAADLEGIYLQPELPIWGMMQKKDTALLAFLEKEGEHIQREYGNHASFVMFALGNELGGEATIMKSFVDRFRQIDNRHLYAYGSNNFLGFQGHTEGEDYLTTCRVGGGDGYTTHVRGSFSFADAEEGGFINNTYPNSVMNFSQALQHCPVPVISHETGQFQVYPNYAEMKKYTGVLAPWNFEVFRERLKEKGMLEQADDFFRASGALAVLLYRADIEMDLRTPELAGFQLLDLQDYLGQGSAYVGILDAFMDSKRLITSEQWRAFCNEVVPLFATEKFCWSAGERLNGTIDVTNYSGKSLGGKILKWELNVSGKRIGDGQIKLGPGNGLLHSGRIEQVLPDVERACKMELHLSISGTDYRNTYPLWVYPTSNKQVDLQEITVARTLTDEVLGCLKQGGKVLLMPHRESCKEVTVGGLFQSDYWNYRMFKSICDHIQKPASPGTLGLLMDPNHPLFRNFPTEYHTNWQWYSIVKQSYPLILDRLPIDCKPLVQVIDNVERNHKLGLVVEMAVEKGKLLICMSDLDVVKEKPEVRQFYKSLIEYMQSDTFAPVTRIGLPTLKSLFTKGAETKKIDVLNNISYD